MAAPVIIVIGPPGAGKGTQSDILAKRLGGVHLSSGQIFREQTDDSIAALMARGEMVDLQTFKRIAGSSITAVPSSQALVLDGFIRLPEDETWLVGFLERHGRTINKVIYLKIDESVADSRNLDRHRIDDNVTVLQRRWAIFRAQTMPVIKSLAKSNHLITIDGYGSVDEVARRIEQAML